MDSGYSALVNAIFHASPASADSRNFDEKVTLTEAVVVNGGTQLPAYTTLNIKRPVSAR